MIAFTLTEWVVVGLVLVFGWILGLLSSSGGKKWRARYEAERQAHADARTAHAEALKAEQERYRTLETRHAELERSRATPVAAATTAGTAATATASDDLSRIRGIGADGEPRLAEQGIRTYADVEALSGQREHDVEQRFGLERGTIEREGWREQARLLREGQVEEHRRRYGA